MNVRALRVLVVDDSAINRRTLSSILREQTAVDVVGTASGGDEALRLVASLNPDLITLDLEMPRMDGFTFLRLLMASRPTPVVVVSNHSAKENVFRALELGAIDFIAKPDQLLAGGGTEGLRLQLEQMIRVVRQLSPSLWRNGRTPQTMAGLPKATGQLTSPEPASPPLSTSSLFKPGGKPSRILSSGHGNVAGGVGLSVDSTQSTKPSKLVVIASSTGGPTALLEMFSKLPVDSPAALLVAQHMPERFTGAFAQRLDRLSSFTVREAGEHQLITAGLALICPGGRCLEVRRAGDRYVAHVVWPEQQDRYAPSADRLFISAARVASSDVIGVVLTGMGDDGASGAEAIKEAGGRVLVESEETAVVFGMPRAAAQRGAVDHVLPLSSLVDCLVSMLRA